MTLTPELLCVLVRSYVGCSLSNRRDDLCTLIARGVDDPATILAGVSADCGMFALGIWCKAGVQHPILQRRYQVGMAIHWVIEIAQDLSAMRYPKKDGPPRPGALMLYFLEHKNDDHVEFCLSEPSGDSLNLIADHAGGGRADDAIGEATSPIEWSSGRPLQLWIDADALLGTSP